MNRAKIRLSTTTASIALMWIVALTPAGISYAQGVINQQGKMSSVRSTSGTSISPDGTTSSASMSAQVQPLVTVSSLTLDTEEAAFFTLINNFRAQNGAGPLQVSVALQTSSLWMSNDMGTNRRFDHTDSLGRDFQTRLTAFGYPYLPAGENIAAGYVDAASVFLGWMNACDPDTNGVCTFGHRQNMLDPSYKVMGIGRVNVPGSPYGWYWTTDFGGVVDQLLNTNPSVPSAVAVIPNSGTGSSQTFQFQVSDRGGASDLVAIEGWITPSPSSAANSCLIYYGVASHLLYLGSDDVSTWSSQTIGTAGTLQNSQCSLNVGGAIATPSGNNLTLSVPVSFKAPFAGIKQIFLFAVGSAANSGWQIMGTWTTSTASASVVSVTPTGGTGTTQTFQFKAADTGGFWDLQAVEGWITPSPAKAVNTCLIYFSTTTQLLYLAADNVASWTPQTIGTAGTLQNSQCSVNVGGATVSGSGNTLTLSVPITFKPAFAGTKQIFEYAVGTNGNSNWQIMGIWTPSPAAASLVSVTPNAGSGSSQTFQFKASDTGGAADLQAVEGWFTPSAASAVNTCLIYFATATQLLYLMNDASGWTSQQIGTAGTLQNSQCSLNVGGATAVSSGNTFTLSVPVTFKPAFTGAKQTWMSAVGTNGSTGFQNMGSWTVP